MKVLIAASDKAELKGFGDYDKVVTGVGPIMAAAAVSKAIAETKADAVLSVGSAGAVPGRLQIGDIASFSSVVSLDQDLTFYHLAFGSTLDSSRATVGALRLSCSDSGLVLASSSSFVSGMSDELALLNASACDMECYGVALAARLYSIPCLALKAITDIVGQPVTLGEYGFSLRSLRSLLAEKAEEMIRSL